MIYNNIIGGDEGNRTPGLLVANETLSRTELRPHIEIWRNVPQIIKKLHSCISVMNYHFYYIYLIPNCKIILLPKIL